MESGMPCAHTGSVWRRGTWGVHPPYARARAAGPPPSPLPRLSAPCSPRPPASERHDCCTASLAGPSDHSGSCHTWPHRQAVPTSMRRSAPRPHVSSTQRPPPPPPLPAPRWRLRSPGRRAHASKARQAGAPFIWRAEQPTACAGGGQDAMPCHARGCRQQEGARLVGRTCKHACKSHDNTGPGHAGRHRHACTHACTLDAICMPSAILANALMATPAPHHHTPCPCPGTRRLRWPPAGTALCHAVRLRTQRRLHRARFHRAAVLERWVMGGGRG